MLLPTFQPLLSPRYTIRLSSNPSSAGPMAVSASDLPSGVAALEQGLRLQERLAGPERAKLQAARIAQLLAHGHDYSSFWRARLDAIGGAPGAERLLRAGLGGLRLPALTRAELQSHFEAMRARAPGMDAGAIAAAQTSGSTGAPVRVEYAAPARAALQFAMARRHDAWHGRDVTAPLAVVLDVPDGERMGWRPDLVAEGRLGLVRSRNMLASTAGELWDWLAGAGADYLTTTPAMARAMARAALDDPAGRRIALRQVMTHGETVEAEDRALVAEAFGGAGMTSLYGCQEVSWMAMDCPAGAGLHVLDANVAVEIVRPDGTACAEGEPGRVLVTGLISQPMPIVRYDIGDVAEWGPGGAGGGPCACGMTLPLLARVHGRERGFLRMPDGRLRLARITGEHWIGVGPVREFRMLQYADGLVEALVRCARPLTGEERTAAAMMLKRVLDPGLQVLVTEVEAIDWGPGWKRPEVTRVDWTRGERP